MNASAYTPLRPLRSRHVALRHISMHLSEWGAPPGDADAPLLVLLHGWMDVGASFQFVADAFSDGFARSRRMVAPDWRGFGLTRQSGPVDHYTIADCLGDLDALLTLLAPDGAPVDLAGHSLGGHIAMLYAGARPQRVRRVVNLEGFGLPAAAPGQAPARMAQWLDELARLHQGQAGLKPYANAAAVAERLRQNNPRLPADKALWLAGHWAQPDGRACGACWAIRRTRSSALTFSGWRRRWRPIAPSLRPCWPRTRWMKRGATAWACSGAASTRWPNTWSACAACPIAAWRPCRARATCCTTTSRRPWRG